MWLGVGGRSNKSNVSLLCFSLNNLFDKKVLDIFIKCVCVLVKGLQ